MADGPRADETIEEYRVRRRAELTGAPPPEATGYEKQLAKVAAQHGSWNQGAPAKKAVNLDTAATDADELGATHKSLAGGVKKLDKTAIAAADADKSWAKMSPEEQARVAKSGGSSKPAGVAHSTSTPGAAHQTAMAAAMTAAGVPGASLKPSSTDKTTGQPTYRSKDKALTVTPAVAARNNMATPRSSVDTSAVAGVTSKDSPDTLAAARAAATKGSRGAGNKAAESAAAAKSAKRASTARSAASGSPVTRAPGTPKARSAFDQKYEVTGRSAAFSYSLGIPQGASSAMSARPTGQVSTSKAQDEAIGRSAWPPPPVAGDGTKAGRNLAKSVPASNPTKGVSYDAEQGIMVRDPSKDSGGYGTSAPVSNPAPHAPTPASNATPAAPSAPTAMPAGPIPRENIIGSKPSKGVSPAHMVSSAPGRDFLTPQAANKAKSRSKPATAVAEPVAESPAGTMVGESNLGPTAAKKARAASAAPTAMPEEPSHMAAGEGAKVSKNVGAAVGNVNRGAMPSGNDYSGARDSIGQQRTPLSAQQMGNASKEMPVAPSRGRSGGMPRSSEVGGGRVSSGAAGGLHIANEGDNNAYSNIGNVTHNTTVHNYGTMTGNSIGSGNPGAGRAGGSGGGMPRGGGSAGGGAGGHDGFNAWYKDAHGMHDLQKSVKHVTGQTGGHGEDLTGAKKSAGGVQRPIKNSPRGATVGGSAPQQPIQGTGTTNNWTGPVHTAPTSASGNGTATKPIPQIPGP